MTHAHFIPGRLFFTIIVIVGMAIAARDAKACAVPVFQYAMQNWPPDDYTLIVVHRGPLDARHQDLLESWQRSSEFLDANIQFRLVDLDGDDTGRNAPDGALRALLPPLEDQDLPYAVLRYPDGHPELATVWQGPLDHTARQHLCTSPLRQQIARRLTRGDTAVWVLLDSGHRAQDDRAAALLEEQLKLLEEQLVPGQQPAAPAGDVPQTELESDDIPVRFSILRLTRDDPDESILISMLLHSEPDLEELDAPMAFPIFGRGRALYALIGGGITPEVITKAAAFLVGGCSCIVKAQNPGIDLLISCDWENSDNEAAFVTLPESSASSMQRGNLTSGESAAAGAEVTEAPPPLWRNAVIGLGLGVGVVALFSFLIIRRGQGTRQHY